MSQLIQPDWFKKDEDDVEDEDSSGENGSGEEAVVPGGTQHILILLDCDPNMFEATMPDPEFPEEKLSAVSYSLSALQDRTTGVCSVAMATSQKGRSKMWETQSTRDR